MRNKQWILIFFLSGFFLNSCIREEVPVNFESSEKESFIETARPFFEELDYVTTRNGGYFDGSMSPGDFTPLWDKAIYDNKEERYEYLYVPITNASQFIAKIERKTKKGSQFRHVQINQVLSILHDKETGMMDAHIISFIPTKAYYNKNKQRFGEKFLSTPDRGEFSGVVLIHFYRNMRVLRINKYTGGEKEHGFSVFKVANNEEYQQNIKSYLQGITIHKQNTLLTRSDDEIDQEIELPEVVVTPEEEDLEAWIRDLIDQINAGRTPDYGGGYDGNEGNNDGNTGGGGTWDGNNGGGSSGSGNNNNNNNNNNNKNTALDPICSDESTLTNAQKKLLDAAIKDMLLKLPDMKELYEALIKAGIEIAFHMDINLDVNADYDATTNSITFKSDDAIGWFNLSEELVHALQCNEFYFYDRMSYESNIEFEAKVYLDILNQTGPGGGMKGSSFISDRDIFLQYGDWILDFVDKKIDFDTFMKSYHSYLSHFKYPKADGTPAGYIPGKEPEFINKYLNK